MRAISRFAVNLIPNNTFFLPSLSLGVCSSVASLSPVLNLLSSSESSFLFAQCIPEQWERGGEGGGGREREGKMSEKTQAVVTYQGFLSKMKVSKYQTEMENGAFKVGTHVLRKVKMAKDCFLLSYSLPFS